MTETSARRPIFPPSRPASAPQQETYRIQEDHLAIYHLLCAYVEYELFEQ